MQSCTSVWNEREKMHNFSRQNSRKLCDISQRNCCLPVLLHPLERRCVSSLASGNFALNNKRFSLEEATILLDLVAKSGDISRMVSATTKFIPTVSVRGIVELENSQEAASQCISSLSFDVKKCYRCSSLALNHHCVVWCMNIVKLHAWAQLLPVTLTLTCFRWRRVGWSVDGCKGRQERPSSNSARRRTLGSDSSIGRLYGRVDQEEYHQV